MTDLTEMTKLFSVIKSKKDDITELEKIIKVDFNQNVINFFKEKGFEFIAIDNKYDPINRYRLNGTSYHNNKNFRVMGAVKATGEDYTSVPKFDIVPWEFTIKFVWWKSTNQNPTNLRWHPEEISLEDFYNKKLKKVFNLI